MPTTVGRVASVSMDADRCYYGSVDEDGGVVRRVSRNVREGPAPTPSPSLSPLEVVDVQFEALVRGSFAGVKEAYQFLSPAMIEKYQIDENKFKAVLEGDAFDGLIGVAEWEVTDMSQPSDDVAVVKLRALPKPVAGCVRTSGVAGQAGITWPTNFKWMLGKVPSDAA